MPRWPFLLSLALIGAIPVEAGVVYEIEVSNHAESPQSTETIRTAIEGKNLKMGIGAAGPGQQGEMIYRGDRREMVVVDHERKSFFVMDEEAIRAIATQLSQAMAEMEKALAGVPESQRAQIEAMMKGRMPQQQEPRAPAELRRTGERAEHGGYSCSRVDVVRAGRTTQELCVSPWSEVEGSDEVVALFEDMAEFLHEMLDALPRTGGKQIMDENPFEHMKELDGFPVHARQLAADGSVQTESTLLSAQREDIDPAVFEPPPGYKRQEMFGSR